MIAPSVDIEFATGACQKRAVLICVDRDYEPYAFVLIEQILRKSKVADFDICLVGAHEISTPKTLDHLPIRIGKLSVALDDTAFPQNHHVGLMGYYGIFATSVLAAQYDRILTLDADMLFLGRDLNDLMDIELCPGHAIGAVRDLFQQRKLRARPKESEKLGIGHFPYFNSGVVLIDTEQWIAQRLYDRLLETIRTHGEAFTYTDQSAWNLTLRGEWSELSWEWNWIFKPDIQFQLDLVNPQIVHFAGSEKPWFTGRRFHPKRFVEEYETFLQRHYGRALEPAPPRLGRDKKKSFLKLLWRNYRTERKLRKYKSRFLDRQKAIDPRS